MEQTEWLLAHGIIDFLLALVVSVVGWLVRGLKEALQAHTKQSVALSEALNALSLMVSREYLPREEYRQDQRAMLETAKKEHDGLWQGLSVTNQRVDRVLERTGGK